MRAAVASYYSGSYLAQLERAEKYDTTLYRQGLGARRRESIPRDSLDIRAFPAVLSTSFESLS